MKSHKITNHAVKILCFILNTKYVYSYKNCLEKIESVRLVGFGVNPGPNDTSCVQRSTAECENVYGAHAFCRDELCYCDKRYHYLTTDGKCGK